MLEKKDTLRQTKFADLYNKIRAIASKIGPDAQLPPVRSLCEELKTTRVTLSEVLNQLEAENIVYRKNRQGIFVSPMIDASCVHIFFNSTWLLSPLVSPFWSILLIDLQREMERRSAMGNARYQLHLMRPGSGKENTFPEEAKRLLHSVRVDGLLSVGFNTKGWLLDLPVQCVTFAGGGEWMVQIDGYGFGKMAAYELIKQGCKRPGFWSPLVWPDNPLLSGTSYEGSFSCKLDDIPEFIGFREMLLQQKCLLYPELTRFPPHLPFRVALTNQELGYLLAREVFTSPQALLPDGLVISDDLLTDGALVAFEELGIRIGEDIKIVTHANVGSLVLFGRTRRMTVLEFDPHEIVEKMFALLDQLLGGQPPGQHVQWIRCKQRPI